jgi:hypothetical protein
MPGLPCSSAATDEAAPIRDSRARVRASVSRTTYRVAEKLASGSLMRFSAASTQRAGELAWWV